MIQWRVYLQWLILILFFQQAPIAHLIMDIINLYRINLFIYQLLWFLCLNPWQFKLRGLLFLMGIRHRWFMIVQIHCIFVSRAWKTNRIYIIITCIFFLYSLLGYLIINIQIRGILLALICNSQLAKSFLIPLSFCYSPLGHQWLHMPLFFYKILHILAVVVKFPVSFWSSIRSKFVIVSVVHLIRVVDHFALRMGACITLWMLHFVAWAFLVGGCLYDGIWVEATVFKFFLLLYFLFNIDSVFFLFLPLDILLIKLVWLGFRDLSGSDVILQCKLHLLFQIGILLLQNVILIFSFRINLVDIWIIKNEIQMLLVSLRFYICIFLLRFGCVLQFNFLLIEQVGFIGI